MAFKLKRSVFMFLGQGGHKSGVAENADRGFVIFVSARNPSGGRKEAVKALLERGWQDVDILRGGEVPARPDKQPHDAAWQEAREGKRGIIVYDEKAEARAATEHPPRQA